MQGWNFSHHSDVSRVAHISSPRWIDGERIPFDTRLTRSQRHEICLGFLIITQLCDGLDGFSALVEVVLLTEQVLNCLSIRNR